MAKPEGVSELPVDKDVITGSKVEFVHADEPPVTPTGVFDGNDAAMSAEQLDQMLSDEGKIELSGEPQRPRIITPEQATKDRLQYIIELEHELNAKSRRLYDTQCIVAALLRQTGETRVPKEFIAEADPSRVSIVSGFDGADVVFRLKAEDES